MHIGSGFIKSIFLFGTTGAILICSCSKLNGPELKNENNSITGKAFFKMAVSPGSPFASITNSATVTISAPDMYTLTRNLTITDSSVEGLITGIPAGKDRKLEINVYDSNKVIQYTGTAQADVIADSTVNVKIDVIRVLGDISVNGNIIESSVTRLVAYYPFNGNALDGSGLLNDGIVNGATLTTDRFGKENSAYLFDGVNDYIEVPFDSSIACKDSISVTLWAKSNITGDKYSNFGVILQMGEGSENAYTIDLCTTSDKVQLEYRQHWTNSDSIIDGGVRIPSLLDTSWHFYAFTFNGKILTGYFDSMMIDTIHAISGPIENTPLRIGAESKSSPPIRFWNGKIDDIGIYHSALTQNEIMWIKNKKR